MTGELTQERLKELLHYDPQTGVFTWKVCIGRRSPAGTIVKGDATSRYVRIQIEKVSYRAHRLAWLYQTGQWPSGDIDHINGDKKDNRFSNLREATRSQNLSNIGPQKNNKSGFKGVCFNKMVSLWEAQITKNYQHRRLGYFNCPREAAHAYNKAAIELHGEFAVLNPI